MRSETCSIPNKDPKLGIGDACPSIAQALSLIKNHQAAYEGLRAAMQQRKSVAECIRIVEEAEAAARN